MNNLTTRARLELHLAVFLWGFTAILGDWIALSALTLVFWRVLLTSVMLLPLVRPGTLRREVSARQLCIFAGLGCIVSLHWVTFYGAVKLANASVCLIAMATTSVFSAVVEPWVVGRRFVWAELGVGTLVLPGIWLISEGMPAGMEMGLLVGLASALLVAIFTSFNKRYVEVADPLRITFVELGAGSVFLLPLVFLVPGEVWPSLRDWALLLVLAAVCTVFTNWLFLRALRHVSAFAATLTVNLEPVYGMALAFFLLDDGAELGPRFYWGAGWILVVVVGFGLVSRGR